MLRSPPLRRLDAVATPGAAVDGCPPATRSADLGDEVASRFVSRGVVLWPDPSSSEAVSALWKELSAAGLPSLQTHTHRLHRPHVSMVVAQELDVASTSLNVGPTPPVPIPFRVEMAGVFPGGVLVLPVVPSVELLAEQQRISTAIDDIAIGRWPFTWPGAWSPHMTCAYGLTGPQIDDALAIAFKYLPLVGHLSSGGIEDGSTGENWPSTRP